MKLPILYKKTNTGALQTWLIETKDNEIITRFGQLDGKIQETVDVIRAGKNAGKANATSKIEQAELEAKAKWTKQKKKGYVETIQAAKAGELDEVIEGGIVPMLAHSYSDHAHKITYPAYAQRKYDGIRCIAVIEGSICGPKCTLWSRTRKLITGVPHIQKALEDIYRVPFHCDPMTPVILDGELYNHDFKEDFEKIVSFVRQDTPKEGHEVVQYHVYDTASMASFGYHLRMVNILGLTGRSPHIKVVETLNVADEQHMLDIFGRFTEEGYEGLMLRNIDSTYVNKRSYDLQKVKSFLDNEFAIVGVEEGRGRLQGHVGAFVCLTEDNKEFKAKLKGSTEYLKELFENPQLWLKKKLTVKYQNDTGDGIPRFPVGIAIRDKF